MELNSGFLDRAHSLLCSNEELGLYVKARRWPKVEVRFAQRLRPYSSIKQRSGQCLFDVLMFTAGINQPCIH